MAGVCTHPDYRGRGLFRRNFAQAKAATAYDARNLFCIPANDSLFGLYESVGLRKRTCASLVSLDGSGSGGGYAFDGDYERLYALYLASGPDVRHPFPLFRACVDNFLAAGSAYYVQDGFALIDGAGVRFACGADADGLRGTAVRPFCVADAGRTGRRGLYGRVLRRPNPRGDIHQSAV